jgi:hypothetical protein
MQKQEITIEKYNKFQMIRKGQFGYFKVGSLNTVAIPVNQGIRVPGMVCVPAGEQLHVFFCEGITDPVQKIGNDMSAEIGRSPTAGNDAVPVRMLNTTDEPCIIRKGTCTSPNSSVCFMIGTQIDKPPKTKQVKARLKKAHRTIRRNAGQEKRRQNDTMQN